MYSDDVKAILNHAGWFPERTFSLDKWLPLLEKDGMKLSAEATKILENLGDIVIRREYSKNASAGVYYMHFDPTCITGDGDKVQAWECDLNIKLSPIGEIEGAGELVLGSDNKLYMFRDRFIWLLGDTFQDALENCLLRGTKEPVLVSEWDNN